MARTLQESRQLVPQDSFILEMRDLALQLKRTSEVLLTDNKFALEFKAAQKAEEQVTTEKKALIAQNKLNTLAAFTFPILTLATIFGMNLVHGFEDVTPILFWVILIGSLGMGIIIKKWLFVK